jgi:outer membrane protein OmpA-like peptidoglycan-associated protein
MKHTGAGNLFRVGLLLATFLAGISAAKASDSDAEKLRELERAMNATGPAAVDGGSPTKKRTRAIVFDAEPQAATQNSTAVSSGGGADCQSLPPGATGISVDFTINFNIGSATISQTSENTLDQIAKVLALNPSTCIIVEGHTDSTGNAERNMSLSRDRAASVVNYVSTRSNIERRRLVPIGKGSNDPLRNLDARDPKNRRVVFKVVGS